jgi:hypothetical protein
MDKEKMFEGLNDPELTILNTIESVCPGPFLTNRQRRILAERVAKFMRDKIVDVKINSFNKGLKYESHR